MIYEVDILVLVAMTVIYFVDKTKTSYNKRLSYTNYIEPSTFLEAQPDGGVLYVTRFSKKRALGRPPVNMSRNEKTNSI